VEAGRGDGCLQQGNLQFARIDGVVRNRKDKIRVLLFLTQE